MPNKINLQHFEWNENKLVTSYHLLSSATCSRNGLSFKQFCDNKAGDIPLVYAICCYYFCVEISENAANIGKCGINFKSDTWFLPEKRKDIYNVVFNYGP